MYKTQNIKKNKWFNKQIDSLIELRRIEVDLNFIEPSRQLYKILLAYVKVVSRNMK